MNVTDMLRMAGFALLFVILYRVLLLEVFESQSPDVYRRRRQLMWYLASVSVYLLFDLIFFMPV